mgnify:CR=1 FL=1
MNHQYYNKYISIINDCRKIAIIGSPQTFTIISALLGSMSADLYQTGHDNEKFKNLINVYLKPQNIKYQNIESNIISIYNRNLHIRPEPNQINTIGEFLYATLRCNFIHRNIVGKELLISHLKDGQNINNHLTIIDNKLMIIAEPFLNEIEQMLNNISNDMNETTVCQTIIANNNDGIIWSGLPNN